jgi:hypothetical protein
MESSRDLSYVEKCIRDEVAALTADAQPVGDAPLEREQNYALALKLIKRAQQSKEPHSWIPYFSTYCLHGNHEACRANCKSCQNPCKCDCGHPASEPLVYKDADAPSCPHEHPLRRTNAGGKIEYSCADCGTLIEFGGVPVPTPLHSWEQIVDRATQAAQQVADSLGCGHLHFRSTEWGKRIIAAAVKVAQESRDAEWGAWGIVEVSVRNPSVVEYMKHWEERATKAEAEIAQQKEQS